MAEKTLTVDEKLDRILDLVGETIALEPEHYPDGAINYFAFTTTGSGILTRIMIRRDGRKLHMEIRDPSGMVVWTHDLFMTGIWQPPVR